MNCRVLRNMVLFVSWFGILTSSEFLPAAIAQSPRVPWTTSRIKGYPEPPLPYKVVDAFPQIHFEKPTSLEEIPGADSLLVTEMSGKVFSLSKQHKNLKPALVLDLGKSSPGGVSLFDAEFHPQYERNGFLYLCYVSRGDREVTTRVSRIKLTQADALKMVQGSEQILLTWPAGGHNGGCLEFGTDGYLYISTGDGAGPNPPDGLTTGQDISDLLGSILRIDVDHSTAAQPYSVPSDNPFVQMKSARPEVWSYGLRNPWKFGVDHQTGDIYVADNGWETWELIHKIDRGGNSGWPIMEGRASLRSEVERGPTPITPPVKDHHHSEANSVIGGPVYRGAKYPELQGSFVYGGYITGTIWSVTPEKNGTYTSRTLTDTDLRIVAFTEGSAGEIFILDYDYTGKIYELAPSGLKDTSAEFPRRLSETGLFENLETLQPSPGIVPYIVRVEPWTDGATAKRWIAIPGDEQVELSNGEDPSAVWPDGTVLFKHLEYPTVEGADPIRLETQILHRARGTWHTYSYLWDDAGKEAHLVDSIGANRAIQVPDSKGEMTERTWHVSAHNECRLCHNPGSHFVLGFSPEQLNVALFQSNDQLKTLRIQRVIKNRPEEKISQAFQLVDPFDERAKLDDRARSYLHVNCSHCHHPGGNAIVSFYLRRDLPFDKLNTNKGTGIGTFGMQNARLIVPGDPYRSVLMYRMSKLGYGRMPYIGSQVVDSRGVALVEEWIRSMPHQNQETSSPPLVTGTAESKALQILDRQSADSKQRSEAIGNLVQSTEGSLALITRLHSGVVTGTDRATAIDQGNRRSGDIRGLFESFIPEAERRPTLGPNPKPEFILSLAGDEARGKLIFFSDNARCRVCHNTDDPNKSLGPTLIEINKKYPRLEELLQHALNPSLKIDDKFVGYVVVTNDGKVYNGLLIEQTQDEVVLKTTEFKTIHIPPKDIDSMQKSNKSLMPEKILSDLTVQEAADLFAYLRSLGEQ